MSARIPVVAANWKMNGSRASTDAWLATFGRAARELPCESIVCPPAPYLRHVADALAGLRTQLGAQDVSERVPGAFTGDTAAEMLIDVGCHWVIIGHSERRLLHGETDATVAAKAARALEVSLRPIVCVGETLEEREAGRTLQVVSSQLDAVVGHIGAAGIARGVLAYEPVWAIGTGRTASAAQAQEVHAALRARLVEVDATLGGAIRILYGGSVKPSNAAELFGESDIDGGLIGGASLIASDFLAICEAAESTA
jgi:triosephosphate isomerase